MFGKNSNYRIRTPNGWEDFSGIQKISDRKVCDVILSSGKQITVTLNHQFYEKKLGFVDVSVLHPGDSVKTKGGYESIVSITPRGNNIDVYDLTNTGKYHCYYTNNILSHNCTFLGSSQTLISGQKLQALAMKKPIYTEILGGIENKNGTFDIYEQPVPKNTYVMCVDVAEGQNLDYSAFSVFDVTHLPYKQVAKYRNNNITPAMLPAIVYATAKKYNDAFILVEINSIGLQVSDILHYEMAYENLLKFQMKGKQGNQPSDGFASGGRNKIAFGLRTTAQSKMIGCSNLKALIESDKLLIHDADTIMELSTFSTKGRSFAAEEGNNDDLAMTLVHFGWLTSQKYFKENISEDIKSALQQEQMEVMDTNIVPFGFIDNGINKPLEDQVDKDGDYWFSDRGQMYPFDDLNYQWDSRL